MLQNENVIETVSQQLEPPYVSIIVPVYNVETTLRACLMSAVFQTLSEVEVIVVNDASPDNSQAIIDEFASRFPNKVRCVVHEQNQGLAYARRTGLRNASAPYVLFLDSDDFISGDACAVLLEQMHSESLDLLYFPLLRCHEGSTKREMLSPPAFSDQETMIKSGMAAFCGAMYRREFLEKYEHLAFVPMLYEDAATTPTLMSKTERIGVYRKKALYYYRYMRKDSICAQQISVKKMQDIFAADALNLDNISSELQDAYAFRVIKRAGGFVWNENAVYDYGVQHVKEILRRTRDREYKLPDSTQRIIDRAVRQPDEICIPKIVYVNGFVRNQLKNFDHYLEQACRAYLFDPEVVVLDESVCDMALLPEWLKDSSGEEKGLYFAVRSIRERGGIYISPAVQIVTSFNREAFRGAFFVAGPETTVLPCAFGAAPESPLMEKLQEMLDREQTTWSRNCVEDVMAHVLVGECGVHLNGKDEYGLHNLHMLAFSDIVRGEKADRNYCILNYNNYIGTADDMVCVPEYLNDFAWQLAAERMEQLQEEKNAANKARKEAEANAAAEKKKAAKIKKEFDRFRRTKLYKFAKRIHDLLPKGLRKLLWK